MVLLVVKQNWDLHLFLSFDDKFLVLFLYASLKKSKVSEKETGE